MVYDVDSIKQRNSIADVIAAHGVALCEFLVNPTSNWTF